jgi:hypothetical protein
VAVAAAAAVRSGINEESELKALIIPLNRLSEAYACSRAAGGECVIIRLERGAGPCGSSSESNGDSSEHMASSSNTTVDGKVLGGM